MEYVKISKVDTIENGFVIEVEEMPGHYIYVTPSPPQQPDSSIADEGEDDDNDNEIIWF